MKEKTKRIRSIPFIPTISPYYIGDFHKKWDFLARLELQYFTKKINYFFTVFACSCSIIQMGTLSKTNLHYLRAEKTDRSKAKRNVLFCNSLKSLMESDPHKTIKELSQDIGCPWSNERLTL